MNIKTFLPTAIIGLSVICSCKKSVNASDLETGEQTVIIQDKDNTPLKTSIVWMAGQDSLFADISRRASAVRSAVTKNDKIVFTTVANAKSDIQNILAAYENNAVIIFIRPVMNHIVSLLQENNLVHLYPKTNDYLYYAISKSRGSYGLRKPVKCTVTGVKSAVEGTGATVVPTEEDLSGEPVDPYKDYNPYDPAYIHGPLVRWINGIIEPYTKASVSTNDNACEYRENLIWNCDLYVHNCGANSSDDRIKGTFIAGFSHKVTPLFSQGSATSNISGDFYKFNTDYFLDPSGVWKGDDFCDKHGGIYVHITGAFMRNICYKTYISGDGSNPEFYCQPQPGTDNNSVNYSETDGFQIGGGVTAGVTGGKATATGSFTWGYSQSSTVSQSVSDVSVANNSKISDIDANNNLVGSSAAWKFTFNNLPEPSGDKGFNRNCPESAHSYHSFPTQWVWHSKSDAHSVGSTASIGTLVTEITPVLGGCHNGYCVDGEKNTWEIGMQRSEVALVAPIRVIFGTANIVNDLGDNCKIHDFVIKEHSGDTVYSNTSDLLYGKGLEFSVPKGNYDITAKVWNSTDKADKDYFFESYEVVPRMEEEISDISFERNFKEVQP